MNSLAERLKTPVRMFQRTQIYFNMVRSRYFRDHPIYDRPDNCSPELRELLDTGLLILPEFHDSRLIAVISEQAYKLGKRLKEGGDPELSDTVIYPDDGIYRLRNVEAHIPESKIVIDNPYLRQLAAEYLRYPLKTSGNYLDYKPDIGKHDYTTVPHMDQWKSSIKIFTLLSDVTEDNAPMVYWKGSHFDQAWRRPLDYLNWLGTDIGSAGICPPHLLRKRADMEGGKNIEEAVITGKAGTVVVADTRGFHRASNLNAGYRLQMVQKFTVDYYKTMFQLFTQ
ncbi:MAG: hypothetical protein AB1781_08315 [Pseudomonadota bacterium]